MICSEKHNFIFVHIPKTAGSSVQVYLYPYADFASLMKLQPVEIRKKNLIPEDELEQKRKHLRRIKHANTRMLQKHGKNYFNKEFKQYFRFGFVRNPWDRVLSIWNYCLPSPLGHRVSTVRMYSSWEDFILQHNPKSLRGWGTCYSYLYLKGEQMVDFVGRFEHLCRDMQTVCEQIGVPWRPQDFPHEKKPEDRKQYREYYTPELRDCIAEKYADDIETFGYKF
jgi:hypothetical protein